MSPWNSLQTFLEGESPRDSTTKNGNPENSSNSELEEPVPGSKHSAWLPMASLLSTRTQRPTKVILGGESEAQPCWHPERYRWSGPRADDIALRNKDAGAKGLDKLQAADQHLAVKRCIRSADIRRSRRTLASAQGTSRSLSSVLISATTTLGCTS